MTFTVYGSPAPQGSKRHIGNGVMIESSKNVKPWRIAVEQAVMLQYPPGLRKEPILIRGPVALDVTFTLIRPKSAKKGSRPATRPDLDKLIRSTKDALKTAGVYEDDGRVVSLISQKYFVGHDPAFDDCILSLPGAVIRVEPA